VSERAKAKQQSNGRDQAAGDRFSVNATAADDRSVYETPVLHSGARLAAKLKAKIIVNGTEFDHAGEMSVDDRQLYHEALEAVFPAGIAVSGAEARELGQRKLLWIMLTALARNCFALTRRLLGLKGKQVETIS
jgi:hypothetical protein